MKEDGLETTRKEMDLKHHHQSMFNALLMTLAVDPVR